VVQAFAEVDNALTSVRQITITAPAIVSLYQALGGDWEPKVGRQVDAL